MLSTDATVAWWLGHNGCSGGPFTTALPNRARFDGATAEIDAYLDCAGGAEVILYRIVGGGHAWPGTSRARARMLVGNTCRDFSGVEAVFDFFSRHRLE
ncbi:MAG: hypothetical protein D6E12_02560 [Desulfovibrio sp.]|nr:MAG: hypothetical protein D6E12_02560 [Desulfovibrio sp.]